MARFERALLVREEAVWKGAGGLPKLSWGRPPARNGKTLVNAQIPTTNEAGARAACYDSCRSDRPLPCMVRL